MGIAIQIKYTAIFEGFFFGLVLAWAAVRDGRPLRATLIKTALLALTALAPTVLAIGFYVAIGQFQAFWFANFTSIFLRAKPDPLSAHLRLREDVLHLLILGACSLAGLWISRREQGVESRRWTRFLVGWMSFSLIGFLSVGMYYFHYLLPVYVPLAIGSAPVYRKPPLGIAVALFAMWIPLSNLSYPDFATGDYNRRQVAAMAALIPADVTTGCMQMLEGPPILYKLTNACFLSPYVFPDHLVSKIERPAIGVDQRAELRRILRLRPRALVVNAVDAERNPIVHPEMVAAYRRAGRVMFEGRSVEIWITR